MSDGTGWEKLIGSLAHIIKDKNESDRLMSISLRILSRICDLIMTYSHDIDRNKMKNDPMMILGSLINCIDEQVSNKDLRINALNSLRTASAFLGEFLDRQDIRNFFIERIMYNLNIQDEEVVCLTYQILIEVIKPLYSYLNDDLVAKIAFVSKKHIESKVNQVLIIACEFWSTFASEESFRKENFEVPVHDHSPVLTI